MIQTPRFRADLEVSILPPDMIVVTGDAGPAALEGRVFPHLAPLIDGDHTLEAIIDAIEPRAPILDLHYAMHLLESRGYIVEAATQQDDTRPASAQPREGRVRHRIELQSLGSPIRAAFESELRVRGIEPAAPDDASDATRWVLVDRYLCDDLAELARHLETLDRSWLPIRLARGSVWLGPVFGPGHAACWACLTQRLHDNDPVHAFVSLHGGYPLSTARSHRATTADVGTAVDLIAEALDNGELPSTLRTLDHRNGQRTDHPLPRLAACPNCRPQLRTISTRTIAATDNGYRTVGPEATFERFRHHISPLTGIVDAIRPIHRDRFTQVFSAGFVFPHRLTDRAFIHQGLRGRATGKGMTEAQARTSALGEALERYSGLYRGDEPKRRATLGELGERAVDPRTCLLISDRQYDARTTSNTDDANFIPERFDARAAHDWSPLRSLRDDGRRDLPTAYCYYGAPTAANDFCRPDSNGSAAGNTRDEAILQGFMEVVERDSVAIWWYNRLRRPALDLQELDLPYAAQLAGHYETLGRRLWVLDLTHDVGIPVCAAISLPKAGDHDQLLLGFGAHFDPAIAVARALTEMNQFLPSALRGDPRRISRAPIADTRFLFPDPDAKRAPCTGLDPRNLDEAVDACVQLAADRDLEVLVLDQTRADVGMPVVKVVVPTMRPFWARFAPGRLYTVPVELGWLDQPTTEHELNPAHLLL